MNCIFPDIGNVIIPPIFLGGVETTNQKKHSRKWQFIVDLPIEMIIFHRYVSLSEGAWSINGDISNNNGELTFIKLAEIGM